MKFVIRHRKTRRFWVAGDEWSPLRSDARSFVSQSDAYLAAYHESGEEPQAYEAEPLEAVA